MSLVFGLVWFYLQFRRESESHLPSNSFAMQAGMDGEQSCVDRGGRILANGSRWTTPHTSIDDAEAHAVVEALSTFQQEVQGNDVTILSDNAAVCAALTSGRTKSTAMAPHIRHALEILSPMTWSVAKIDTRANPADEPSRGKDTIRQKALDAAHVQRWGLRRGISMSTECRIPVVT